MLTFKYHGSLARFLSYHDPFDNCAPLVLYSMAEAVTLLPHRFTLLEVA